MRPGFCSRFCFERAARAARPYMSLYLRLLERLKSKDPRPHGTRSRRRKSSGPRPRRKTRGIGIRRADHKQKSGAGDVWPRPFGKKAAPRFPQHTAGRPVRAAHVGTARVSARRAPSGTPRQGYCGWLLLRKLSTQEDYPRLILRHPTAMELVCTARPAA